METSIIRERPGLRAEKLADLLLAGMAVGYIGLYVYIALSRLSYPFDLDWMEGGMVDHVRRLLAGEPLYVAPSIDFVPYIYPPLYFYISAAASALIGPGLLALRLVSWIASLVAFLLIGSIVWKETHDRVAALLSVGLFAATFSISGGWFDLARIDMLFITLTLAGLYAVRFSSSALLAAVLFGLAALTKQTAIAMAVAAVLYYAMTNRRSGLIFATAFAAWMLITTLLLDTASDGWYRYYVFELPGQHAWVWHMLVDFWRFDLAPVLPAGLIGLAVPGVSLRQDRERFLFYGLMLGALVGSAWFSRLHEGGYINGLIPAFTGIALTFGLGVAYFRRQGERRYALISVLAVLQFALLIYNPAAHLVTSADRAAHAHLVETIAAIDGEVLVVHHGEVTSQAGQETIYAHRMAIEDVMRGGDGSARTMLQQSIDTALEQQRFAAILFDGSRDDFILVDPYFYLLEAHYVGRGPVFPPEFDNALWPTTGLQIRPYYVFVPK